MNSNDTAVNAMLRETPPVSQRVDRGMNQRLAACFAALTVIVLFGFPKAGIYLGNIPLTFSYALLGITAMFQLFSLARTSRKRIRSDYLFLGLFFVVLGIVEAAAFARYGVASTGSSVSILVSTLIVPVLTILSVNWFLETLGWPKLLGVLKLSLLLVFIFGIASFISFNLMGKAIGVPFLTTTGSDIQLVAERHNMRGSVIKMYSTYNNGNILGVNLLLWGALVASTSKFSAFQFRSLCILTLSRSVWLGLAAFELGNSLLRLSLKRIFFAVGLIAMLGVVALGATWWMERDPADFMLDADLGGRVSKLNNDLNVVSTQRIGWKNESLYAASYLAFGSIGLALITALWALPIFRGERNTIAIRCRLILAVYMFVSISEAAFNLIPTQACYWLIAAIAMSRHESLSIGVDKGFYNENRDCKNATEPVEAELDQRPRIPSRLQAV